MARKKKHEEHENHERWLVSYADFITLLFAFFVVMYAVSSVNEGKYRVLSDSMVAAFKSSPRSNTVIQLGSSATKREIDMAIQKAMKRSAQEASEESQSPVGSLFEGRTKSRLVGQGAKGAGNLKRLEAQVALAMAGLIAKELIKVRSSETWLEIEIKDSVLFASGSARLQIAAIPVLEELAKIFSKLSNAIAVEGFTDNLPIETDEFPSNWELSTARAASVVHLFTARGIEPTRLSAVGYGEFQPIADNSTPEGRAENRRVVLVVSSSDSPRRIVEEPEQKIEAPAAEEAAGATPIEAMQPTIDAVRRAAEEDGSAIPSSPEGQPADAGAAHQPPTPERPVTQPPAEPEATVAAPMPEVSVAAPAPSPAAEDFLIITPPISPPIIFQGPIKPGLPELSGRPAVAPLPRSNGKTDENLGHR